MSEANPIRLVLVDDLGLFRASLGRFLASEPGFELAGECGTAPEALAVMRSSPVDVVLSDFDVSTDDGTDFMSAARKAGYQGQFLIVAGTPDVRKSALALKAGASGIFLKSEPPERLVDAIKLIAKGGVWVDQKVIHLLADQLVDRDSRVSAHDNGKALGDRERNVLLGILAGLSNRKIGDNMGLSESSVKNVVQRLFSKAGVKTRSQLVRVALEGSLGLMQESIERQADQVPAMRAPASYPASGNHCP